MKIAHIVGSLEARYGGPSRSVRHLAEALAGEDHDVEILTSAPAAAPVESRGRFQVRTWRRAWPSALCRVPEMRAHLGQQRYDIVHHHGLWLRTLHYAERKASRDRIPLVVSPRGMMSPWAWRQHRRRKALAACCLHPNAFRAVAGWHATSTDEAAEIRARGFNQPICVAPNGVVAPAPAEVAAAARHWQQVVPATAKARVALFYSRFHPKKRLIELIDLWAATAPAGWLLLVVGVPEQYSVSQLRSYAHRTPSRAVIEIHDGAGQPPPYAVASLFLLPSHSENFGLVVAEAAAHGVPALVTDTTPWAPLQREAMGWCVAWSDYPAHLASALAESAETLQERGARARTWIRREFSWPQSARQLAEFYAQLKGSPR